MLYTDYLMHLGPGSSNGISQCQFQFRHNKCNCFMLENSTVFGPILCPIQKFVPNLTSFFFFALLQEAAFANAVASAGVVHSISRGCRDGQLASCGCSESKRPNDLKKEWIWGGCGDNIHYGYK